MADHARKTETLVGFFLFIGLALLGSIILLFGNIGDWFRGDYRLSVDFKEATGIIKGSTVRLRGAKIGEVASKPTLSDGSRIRVELDIDERYRIEQGSTFQVGQASLLGDKEIVITPPLQGTNVYYDENDVVMGSLPGGLELLQSEAEEIAMDARKFLEEASMVLTKIELSMEEARGVASKLNVTVSRVNDGLLTDENLNHFNLVLKNSAIASERLAETSELLTPALDEFRLATNDLRAVAKSAQGAIERVGPNIENALEGVPSMVTSLEKTADEASAAIAKIDQGEGTLGAIVSDKEMKDDLKTFVKNLKEDGILRYKDEESPEEDPRSRFRGRRR